MSDFYVQTIDHADGARIRPRLETDDMAAAIAEFVRLVESVPSATEVRLISPAVLT